MNENDSFLDVASLLTNLKFRMFVCASVERSFAQVSNVNYLNGTNFRGTNFRGFFFLEKNCISRVIIFAVRLFKDFFAGINFCGLLILCTFLNSADFQNQREKETKEVLVNKSCFY